MAKKKQSKVKKQDNKIEKNKNIKLISILFLIFGIFLILQGIVLLGASLGLVNSSILGELISQPIAILVTSSVIIILLGVFTIWVARGISNLRNWARLAGVFLSILSIVNSVFSLSLNVIAIISFLILVIIRLWIIQYLIKNKEMFK